MKETYSTLSKTIHALKAEGYSHNFNIDKECLVFHHSKIWMSPNGFKIDAVFRFEVASNPDDQTILYAISSRKLNLKGFIFNRHGILVMDMKTLMQKTTSPGSMSYSTEKYS